MSDQVAPRSRVIKICGVVLFILALACAVAMLVAALKDHQPTAWTDRIFGFAITALVMGIGGIAVLWDGFAESSYWTMTIALALCTLFIGFNSYKPEQPFMGQYAERVPLVIGDWVGVDRPVDALTKKILETEDMVMREYRRGHDMVTLAVIFAMGNRKVAHPPEQCLGAEGREFTEIERDYFMTKEGRRVDGTRLIFFGGPGGAEDNEAAFYWYKAGSLNTGNFIRQQFNVIFQNLMMRKTTRVALIRLMTPMQNAKDRERAVALLKEFAQEVFPEVEKALQ